MVIQRSVFAIGSLLVASALPVQGEMEVSICPAITVEHKGDQDTLFRAYEDLFVERLDEWQFVSANITQYKFYVTPLGRLLRGKPELLEKMVKTMSAMDIGIGIEVGIRHGHEKLIKRTLDPIVAMGGRVDYLVTDNVFVKSQYRFPEDYTWESYEEAVEAYATFVAGIKAKYPDIKIGIIEAAFRYYWADPDQYPAERRSKNNYGDLRQVLEDVNAACARKGVKLDMLQPEYSYSRIEATPNGWEKLKAMEAYCYERGMDFIFLFNDHEGGGKSDQKFHENVIHCLNEVQKNGLNPSMGTLQSWYPYPKEELPETRPHTFTHLAKEFIEINKNRSMQCLVLVVGDDCVQVKQATTGKIWKIPFETLSDKSIAEVKALKQ